MLYSTGHSGYGDWKKRCPRTKIQQKGETPFQLPISRQLKPTAPLLPHPQGERDQLLRDLQELILAMTDKTQASKTLGKSSFADTHFKKKKNLIPGQNRDFLDPRSLTQQSAVVLLSCQCSCWLIHRRGSAQILDARTESSVQVQLILLRVRAAGKTPALFPALLIASKGSRAGKCHNSIYESKS